MAPPVAFNFDGEVAIVTGAGSRMPGEIGNGRATAILLARQGCKVALVDFNVEWAQETKRMIDEEGGISEVIQADVTDEESCKNAIAKTVASFGSVNILVNIVGVGGAMGDATKIDMDAWDRDFRINVTSMVLMSRHAIPEMRKNGRGSIVNMSSVSGLLGGNPSLLYPTTKGAIIQMTRAMAAQHGAENIRVNCVCPGMVFTPMVRGRGMTDDMRQARINQNLMKQEGTGWDVGYGILFLCSKEAKWITGLIMPIDGGTTAGKADRPALKADVLAEINTQIPNGTKLLTEQGPCQSCSSLRIECIPRTRKRRRAAPTRSSSATFQHAERLPDSIQNGPRRNCGSTNAYDDPTGAQMPLPSWPHSHPMVLSGMTVPENLPNGGQTDDLQDANRAVHHIPDERSNSVSLHHIASRDSDITTDPPHEIVTVTRQRTESPTYIGRAYYIGGDTAIDERSARSYTPSRTGGLSDTEEKILELCGSFNVPPKSTRQILMETFMQYCYPWMPTLSQSELHQGSDKFQSLLLMQSMFVAASRISPTPGVVSYASSEQFYQRAKALFWAGHENNPLTVIKAITMLHWYNPDGPAYVSYDASEFWLKMGVGLAYQIGLHKESPQGPHRAIRRRIWWSLAVRDSLISVSHGRPRAINMDDCETSPPCLDDFPESRAQGELFIPYVEICCLLGDLVECCSRRRMCNTQRLHVETVLFRWTRTLPSNLSLSPKQPHTKTYDLLAHNFNARQLHVPYFICLIILARPTAASGEVSSVPVLAASFVAGIYEYFLARDQVKFLSPVFTNFCLVASIVLLSVRPFPDLWDAIQPDLEVMQKCLDELSKRWRSAIGASKALQKAIDIRKAHLPSEGSSLRRPTSAQLALFEGFSVDLCRIWPVYEPQMVLHDTGNSAQRNVESQGNPGEVFKPFSDQDTIPMAEIGFATEGGEQNFMNLEFGGIGEWFMNDWDMTGSR
ncbi:hypothetical protein V496_06321 [Pseudogymnoascus sp. VKM F-4515 (FW-2607)]|nr:hypothetical protein V496_06321 [Pseudogymnoascus sp. VKM F-4515 (FW-2607)]